MNCGSPKEVRYSFSIGTANGHEKKCVVKKCATFSDVEGLTRFDVDKFLKVSDLQRRWQVLAPSGIFIIFYSLESVAQHLSEVIDRSDRAMSEIGELLEQPGRVRGVWRIPDFPSLLQRKEIVRYCSPKFLFLDACWSIYIDCPGTEWLRVYLSIENLDSPKEVCFSFSIRNASGKEEKCVKLCRTFYQEVLHSIGGENTFVKVSDLQSRVTELAPSGVLSICYTLESVAQHSSEGSLFSRLWNLSLSFRNILNTQNKDLTLNLKDGKLSAHRMILESRSPVFERMFDVDLRERQTGEVDIEDATEDAFQVVLHYVYGGDPMGLTCKNMSEVYKIAHKYEFEELRKFCAKFMRETLSMDSVCDVMTVAHLYQEKAMQVCVKDFFAKNKSDIFKSEKWKILKKENLSIVCEILEWVFGEEI